MKNYKLYHKNKLLLNFEIQNFTPISCQIYIENTKYLPLPLKRIINNKEEFIDKTMSDVYIVNDDGCYLFDYWLSNREVPVNRDNYQKYITNKSSGREAGANPVVFVHKDNSFEKIENANYIYIDSE